MNEKTLQMRLGLGACFIALFLVFIAIPNWVAAPSNVANIILSPLFWPYTLSVLTGVVGLGLIATSLRLSVTEETLNNPIDDLGPARLRMIAIAAIMLVSMFLLPRLGMVWTCMLAFAATAFLVQTRHPKTAVACAIAIPLVLYVFFAHVAGVAVPQGNVVRLP